jgi:HEAT repeat protein
MTVWDRIRQWVVAGVDLAERGRVADVVEQAYRQDVVPELASALGDPSPQVARAAVQATRKLGPAGLGLVPALTRLANLPVPADADASARVHHDYARHDALHALGDLLAHAEALRQREARQQPPPDPDEPPPSALDVLLRGAADPDVSVRVTAWVGLRPYLDEPRVRHAALRALDDPEPNVRRQVVAAATPREPQ